MNYKNILNLISENLYSGIFIVDKNGIVIFYNQSANDLAGVNVENAIGKHLLEIFPKLTEGTSTILRALSTGEAIKNYVQNYYNYQSKLVTILSTTIPLYENGEIEGVVEIFSDVDMFKKVSQNKQIKKVDVSYIEKAMYTLNDIIGSSKSKNDIKTKIKKIAESKSPVLVYGETGTGKELVVQSIHNESSRKHKPFIAQNCAAIPGTLLESILFGTTLGSFTGAKDSKGLIESADGGTLFLDELNSMDITLQAKLLRFLQEGYIRRVGENKSYKVDVRVIAALNENPYEAIKLGQIRKDLFYRLNVINFSLPTLRESRGDLDELCNHFLSYYNEELGKNIKGFSDEVIKFFHIYDWPGNIRELKHVIEHAINITENDIINLSDFPDYINSSNENLFTKYVDNTPSDGILSNGSNFSLKPLSDMLNEYERKIITTALIQNECNVSKTAKNLDIPRQTLYYKMDKLKIKVDKKLE
jgi:arginine utilization regulatory protein